MAETTVRIMCPKLTCRKVLAVPTSCRGKTVRCKSCGTNIRVPSIGGGAAKPETKDGTKAA
ncbi:MAG: hypothetical protein GC200_06295 [Tepidisphaera sp.]|nr:hypothetical protein [Tepidisphaera sp.]